MNSVLVVGLTPPPIGGVAICVQTFARAKEIQSDFRILVFDPGKVLPKTRSLGWRLLCKMAHVGGINLNRLRVTRALTRFARKEQDIDLAHVHTSSYDSFHMNARLVKALDKMGIPVVLHLHGGGFKTFIDNADSETRKRILEGLRLPRALIALSEDWKSFYAELLPQQEIHVLANPIEETRAPEKDAGSRGAVLFLGHIKKAKGVADLLESWPGVRAQDPSAELWLAGPDLEGMMAKADPAALQEQGISYHGLVLGEDKTRLLRDASMLVLPSHAEGLPIVILEAMGMGLPVVATRVGAVPEVVTDGCEGILVETADTEQLGQAMLRLLSDSELRYRMGLAGFQRAQSDYHVDKLGRELAEIYHAILDSTRNRGHPGG